MLGASFTEWEPVMDQIIHAATQHIPWNKGRLVGQKAPLKLKDIWAIRVRLQIGNRTRALALFNLAIDSKLRSCDLVKLRARDVCHGNVVAARAMVMQQKTQRPVQFEITEQTRDALLMWIRAAGRRSDDYLFPSRIHGSPHLSTRPYARIVRGWVREIGLDSSAYGTHTMRRTKASLIYRRTRDGVPIVCGRHPAITGPRASARFLDSGRSSAQAVISIYSVGQSCAVPIP
jgi:integrase